MIVTDAKIEKGETNGIERGKEKKNAIVRRNGTGRGRETGIGIVIEGTEREIGIENAIEIEIGIETVMIETEGKGGAVLREGEVSG